MRCGRSITAESGYQLLMLDSPSTGAEDPVVFNAVCLRTALHYHSFFKSVTFWTTYACRSSHLGLDHAANN